MATIQLLKTRNAETITKTAIDQKQSLEVVQTLLHGGLSSLSYLRCFFAEKAFDEQIYDLSDKIHPYEDYAAGRLGKSHFTARTPKTIMRILRRNRSKRADMFLDWLEKGAFPALQAGNLQALQVYVHAEPEDRDKVLETYTFTIKYQQDVGQKRTPSGLEMDKPGSDLVSVQVTNMALQGLLQQIMKLCGELPDLPEKRFLSMALFYNNDVLKANVPSGFMPGATDNLLFAQSEGWEKRTDTLNKLTAGFHDTTIKVSHLQPSIRKGALSGPVSFPEALEYNIATAKTNDIDMDESTGRAVDVSEEAHTEAGATEDRTPSTIIEESNMLQAPKEAKRKQTNGQVITPLPTSDPQETFSTTSQDVVDAPAPESASVLKGAASRKATTQLSISQIEDSFNTQASQIADMKGALNAMMHPERITQGETQTQQLAKGHAAVSEATQTPSGNGDSPSKTTESASPVKGSRPALSQHKANNIMAQKKSLRNVAHQLAQKAGSRTKSGQIILCQCGYAKEEGDMVQCSCCDTWQHLHCYGYTGNDDARLPNEHICYWCLLGDNEKATYKKLGELAIKRRGMHLAMQKGLKSQTEFAEDLGLEMSRTGSVYQDLRREKYVVPTAGSHKAGFKQTGKPLYVPVREGPVFDKMMRNLFDPMTHICHHYQLPATYHTQKMPFTERLISSKLTDMAPPSTPASAKRKQKAAATPASGLDLPAATTPFETPSARPRSRQLQTRKRSLGDDDRHDASMKRRATPGSAVRRLRSVQTEYILDAAGMPSSPINPFG